MSWAAAGRARRTGGGVVFLRTREGCWSPPTRRAGGTLAAFADGLSRLPATSAALAEGRIHRAQADTIAYETSLLDADRAAAVEQLIMGEAPRLTVAPLQLRATAQ